MARLRNRREGTCCERPGVMFEDIRGRCGLSRCQSPTLWFPLLSMSSMPLSNLLAVLPLCVTVWEFCCAGGSPRSAPGRPRGRQLVYYGPHWGTDTGIRACVWISVWLNIWLLFCWGPFQRTAAAWNLEWLLAFSLFFSAVFIVAKLFPSLHLATCRDSCHTDQ